MHKVPLLFEIGDKVFPVQEMYIVFITLGIIGLLLGLWRWWLSAIWFVFPTLPIVLIYSVLQSEEIDYLYDAMVRELGLNYIVHSIVSPIIGTALNMIGIGFGLFNRRKRKVL